MFNDKMDIDDIILDLSTRATKLYVQNDRDCISVAISSQRSVPDFWQVWFDHWADGYYFKDKRFTFALQEAKTLRKALGLLDDWLIYEEIIARRVLEDSSNIIESIGYGD